MVDLSLKPPLPPSQTLTAERKMKMAPGRLREDQDNLERQVGCINGFFHLFDKHQIPPGKRIYSTKRLPSSSSSSSSPVCSSLAHSSPVYFIFLTFFCLLQHFLSTVFSGSNITFTIGKISTFVNVVLQVFTSHTTSNKIVEDFAPTSLREQRWSENLLEAQRSSTIIFGQPASGDQAQTLPTRYPNHTDVNR